MSDETKEYISICFLLRQRFFLFCYEKTKELNYWKGRYTLLYDLWSNHYNFNSLFEIKIHIYQYNSGFNDFCYSLLMILGKKYLNKYSPWTMILYGNVIGIISLFCTPMCIVKLSIHPKLIFYIYIVTFFTDETIMSLNYQVDIDKMSLEEVANKFLKDNN